MEADADINVALLGPCLHSFRGSCRSGVSLRKKQHTCSCFIYSTLTTKGQKQCCPRSEFVVHFSISSANHPRGFFNPGFNLCEIVCIAIVIRLSLRVIRAIRVAWGCWFPTKPGLTGFWNFLGKDGRTALNIWNFPSILTSPFIIICMVV